MKIQVEERHIEAGVPMDPCECPVALAVAEHFPGHLVSVGEDTIDLATRVGGQWKPPRSWMTPPVVANFIRGFDEAAGPEGFGGFEFDLPD